MQAQTTRCPDFAAGGCDFIFVKTPKAASSTAAGVARRIGNQLGLAGATAKQSCPPEPPSLPAAVIWANHCHASQVRVIWLSLYVHRQDVLCAMHCVTCMRKMGVL